MEIIIQKSLVEPNNMSNGQLIEYQKSNKYMDITYHTWTYLMEFWRNEEKNYTKKLNLSRGMKELVLIESTAQVLGNIGIAEDIYKLRKLLLYKTNVLICFSCQ